MGDLRGARRRAHAAPALDRRGRAAGRVDGAVAFERVTVGLRERREPDYTDEGLGIAYSDIGIFRCADVQLAEPLGARAVFDAQTGKPGRAGPGDVHGPTDCPAFPLTGTPPPAR